MPPRSLSALVGAVALGGCSFLGIRTVEEPSYTVVDRLGGSIPVEVRRYPPRLAAETVVDARGGTWKAESDAFGILAGFIFGGNRQRQEVAMTAPVEVAPGSARVAMTAPVETAAAEGDRLVMRFLMPTAYTRDTLPVPTDDRVRIVELPERTLAVLRFTGRGTPEAVVERQTELLKALAGSAWKPAGEPTALFYDPPWTIPFLRRNEVAVPVER